MGKSCSHMPSRGYRETGKRGPRTRPTFQRDTIMIYFLSEASPLKVHKLMNGVTDKTGLL